MCVCAHRPGTTATGYVQQCHSTRVFVGMCVRASAWQCAGERGRRETDGEVSSLQSTPLVIPVQTKEMPISIF